MVYFMRGEMWFVNWFIDVWFSYGKCVGLLLMVMLICVMFVCC